MPSTARQASPGWPPGRDRCQSAVSASAPRPWPVFDITLGPAPLTPSSIRGEERADLEALAMPQTFVTIGPARQSGARAFVRGTCTDAG